MEENPKKTGNGPMQCNAFSGIDKFDKLPSSLTCLLQAKEMEQINRQRRTLDRPGGQHKNKYRTRFWLPSTDIFKLHKLQIRVVSPFILIQS